MTIECKQRCNDTINRITVDRTLTPYDDGLKFCGICNVWFITSLSVLNSIVKDVGGRSTDRKSFLRNQILTWFKRKKNKCPCCGTRLREHPRRHTKRTEVAVRY